MLRRDNLELVQEAQERAGTRAVLATYVRTYGVIAAVEELASIELERRQKCEQRRERREAEEHGRTEEILRAAKHLMLRAC